MRILLVSDHETSGGAAIAASRLAEGLQRSGHEIARLVHRKDRTNGATWPVQTLRASKRAIKVSGRFAVLVGSRTAGFVQELSLRRALNRRLDEVGPDVINVHNIHGAPWTFDLVAHCADAAPVVWTLHDMWSFTGRCAYAYDCRRFVTGCDARCPTPHEYPKLKPQRIRPGWRTRATFFETHPDVVAVTPSTWLAREARKGLWRCHRVEVIPNGIPIEEYVPLDQQTARRALALPEGVPVLLMVADSLRERRKGADYLLAALPRLETRPLALLTLGRGTIQADQPGITLHPLGYLDSSRLKRLAFSAADALVHPAPVDNLPNVVLEAIACGTPTIAFPIGGLPDMVRPGITGWLAHDLSSSALAAAIDSALYDIRDGINHRETCRETAEREYALEVQGEAYARLFAEITRDTSRNSGQQATTAER